MMLVVLGEVPFYADGRQVTAAFEQVRERSARKRLSCRNNVVVGTDERESAPWKCPLMRKAPTFHTSHRSCTLCILLKLKATAPFLV